MSADRVDRTRAVTTRLTKHGPTNQKSVRKRLRKIWKVGFREGRNVGGPSRSDTGRHDSSTENATRQTGSQFARDLKNMWQVGFREGRNVGEPTRHDSSSKLRPD